MEKTIRMAVLNLDDISYPYLRAILSAPEYRKIKRVTYGTKTGCDVSGKDLHSTSNGISFKLNAMGKTWPLRSVLTGEYNIYNIMAAVSVAAFGLELEMPAILEGIRKMQGVPGRMQKIDKGQDFLAIVDFAHTPNALKVALETVKNMKGSGRVIAVFGSAGLRDRQKRRMMAATSIGLADMTILTAEDPRTESLEDILGEMADEAEKSGGVEGKTFLRVPDRGGAIQRLWIWLNRAILSLPAEKAMNNPCASAAPNIFGTTARPCVQPWPNALASPPRNALPAHPGR